MNWYNSGGCSISSRMNGNKRHMLQVVSSPLLFSRLVSITRVLAPQCEQGVYQVPRFGPRHAPTLNTSGLAHPQALIAGRAFRLTPLPMRMANSSRPPVTNTTAALALEDSLDANVVPMATGRSHRAGAAAACA